jgi:Icc-related predicted phosphoesterase
MQGLNGWERNEVGKRMSDFTGLIRKGGEKFTADRSAVINMHHRNWLLDQTDIDIVVTHHAPSQQSITPYWLEHGKHLNPAFAGNSDDIINTLKPKFWIHGHMHNFLRYWHDGIVGGTQVICSPRGYGGTYQEETGFDPAFTITLK